MFGFIRCLFSAHEPHRCKVKKLDSGLYIGHCEFCRAPIFRVKRNAWVRDWKRTLGGTHSNGEVSRED